MSFSSIDFWIVVSKDDFMPMYFSEYELHIFHMSSNKELHVEGVLERACYVFHAINIPEDHWFVHFLIIEA